VVRVLCDNCRKEIRPDDEVSGRDVRVIAGETFSAKRLLCQVCEDGVFLAFFGRKIMRKGSK